jgi:cell division septum initiation protein DivIVA
MSLKDFAYKQVKVGDLDAIEAENGRLLAENQRLRVERDELLAALRSMIEWYDSIDYNIRAAIAKAERRDDPPRS